MGGEKIGAAYDSGAGEEHVDNIVFNADIMGELGFGQDVLDSRAETVQALEAMYGGRIFRYGPYSGTVTKMMACPAFTSVVENGVAAASSWLEGNDGLMLETDPEAATTTVENDPQETNTEVRATESSVPQDTESSKAEKAVVAEVATKKPAVAEPVVEKSVTSVPVTTEHVSPNVVAGTRVESPKPARESNESAVAQEPIRIEKTVEAVTADSHEPEQSIGGRAAEKKEIMIDGDATDSVVAGPTEQAAERSAEIPVVVTVEAFEEVAKDAAATDEIEPTESADAIDGPVDEAIVPGPEAYANHSETGELFEAEITETEQSDEEPEGLSLGASGGVAIERVVPDEPTDAYELAEPEEVDEVTGLSGTLETTESLENIELDLADTMENESGVQSFISLDYDAEPGPTVSEALVLEMSIPEDALYDQPETAETSDEAEVADPETIEEIVEFVGEIPQNMAEIDFQAVSEQAPVVLAVIETLEKAATAEDCHEALMKLKDELERLLTLLGYDNPGMVAEQIINRHDIASLKVFIARLVRSLQAPNTAAVSTTYHAHEQRAVPRKFGVHAVQSVVNSMTRALVPQVG